MSLFFALAVAGGEALTLSGESVVNIQGAPTDAHARLKVDNDGNMYKSVDTGSESYTQFDNATDWVRPPSAAPGAYEVRFTSLTGDALTSSTVAEDTWHPLSSGDFELILSETGTGTNTSNFTIEIRDGGSGGADVSAAFVLTAEAT